MIEQFSEMLLRLRPNYFASNVHPRMSTVFYSSQSALPETKTVRNSKGDLYETDFRNESFEQFYKSQTVCSEADFPQMMSSCRTGLPSVFRIMKNKPNYKLLIEKLKSGLLADLGAKPVPWYGDDLVWRLENTRWDMVDTKDKRVKELHRWIVDQDSLGNIYRQEQVSMVPVKCLDIKSHHTVLDMCSSPGSKTGQVLEALHSDGDPIPSGGDNVQNILINISMMFQDVSLLVNQIFPDVTICTGTWLSSGPPVSWWSVTRVRPSPT